MPCLHDLKYALKATSKQKSNRQIIPHKIIPSAHVYFIDGVVTHYFCHILYGKHMVELKDGGQWLVIRQSYLLTDYVKL